MRIYLSITSNKEIVPYNHIPQLVGVINKWMGKDNKWHGKTSLYSFSWLGEARKGNGGLYFPNGTKLFISAHDVTQIKQILKGIMGQPDLFAGMGVTDVRIRETPVFEKSEEYFTVSGPVLIKRKEGDRIKHCLVHDPESNYAMTETLVTKLKLAGMNSEGVSVSFDERYRDAHTKLVDYNGIKNKANICPVIIKGTQEQIAFAWNVGIGNSTGIGFGALK